jgi:hypothetical protein
VSEPVNWTNDAMFEARDRQVATRAGHRFTVRLQTDGWALIPRSSGGAAVIGMDIWSARAALNAQEATLLPEEGAGRG